MDPGAEGRCVCLFSCLLLFPPPPLRLLCIGSLIRLVDCASVFSPLMVSACNMETYATCWRMSKSFDAPLKHPLCIHPRRRLLLLRHSQGHSQGHRQGR